MNNSHLYHQAETILTPTGNTNYASIFRFKKGVDIETTFTLSQRDYGNMATKRFSIYSNGTTAKIYDLSKIEGGIETRFIESPNYFTLYVKGNYSGVPIKLFVEKLNKVNYLELTHFGEFTRTTYLNEGETLIPISTLAETNGKRVSIVTSELLNGWLSGESWYIERDGIIYVYLNIQNGARTDGTIILNNLPKPYNLPNENDHRASGQYIADGKYYGCILNVTGNGELKIYDCLSSERVKASFSYPKRRNNY